jgi:hypothetical protein
MKRLSSSGLDDLNLGASLEPGATIRFSDIKNIGFSASSLKGFLGTNDPGTYASDTYVSGANGTSTISDSGLDIEGVVTVACDNGSATSLDVGFEFFLFLLVPEGRPLLKPAL